MKIKTVIIFVLYCLTLYSASISAADNKVYNWNIVESWSKNNHDLGTASRLMVKYAKDLSNGKLNITIVNINTQETTDDIFDLVKNNNYQMGHSSSSFWKEKDINMLFFSSLPFGMITPEKQAWFYEGGGLKLMEKVYGSHGLLSFPGGSLDTQMGGWFTKPIKSVKDLNGLRMHITGIAGEVLKSLGVKAIETPSEQVFSALSSGQIEAAEGKGPFSDLDMRFAEVASHYYTAWHEPSSELQFLINQSAYDKLPKNLQFVLKTAMRLAAYDTYTQVRHKNAVKLEELRKKYPQTKIQAFPTIVMDVLKINTNKELRSLESEGGLTTEILNSLKNYKNQVRLWTRIGDQAYLNN